MEMRGGNWDGEDEDGDGDGMKLKMGGIRDER